MGTIIERQRKNGTIAYMAQVVLYRDGRPAIRQAQTFDRRPAAKAWIARREAELSDPAMLEKAKAEQMASISLSDAIERYITQSRRPLGRTKMQVLRSIQALELAEQDCSKITSSDVVELARALSSTRKPQTVANYLSHLGSIFAIARPAWGIPLDPQAAEDAFKVCRQLGYTGKSKERDRRQSLAELDRLLQHFVGIRARPPDTTPMADITAFAIFSTRRQDEISRLAWRDLDIDGNRIFVRDMKHPGDKLGNNVWCDLTPEAVAIIEAQPKTSERIFPHSAIAISAAFTRACQFLEIEDLHFHDLRHDGVSRLFEMGWNIPHVAAVSAHRSWGSLKRYTHLRQTGDKYDGWRWLEILIGRHKAPPVRPRS